MSARHFHSFGRRPLLPGAEGGMERADVVEDARHFVVQVRERVESAAVHVVPKQLNQLNQ